MNRGNRLLLFIAIGAGLLFAVLAFIALQGGGSSNSTVSPGTAKVVVAAQDIPVGTEIAQGMLKTIDVPQSLLVKDAFSDSGPVVGQKARVGILAGEQVATSKIGVASKTEGLNQVLPSGKRAVALSVAEVTAVGGNLLPGNKVDVVAAFKIKGVQGLPDGAHIERTQTVLQNVEVLSIAQNAQEAVPTSDTAAKDAAVQSETSGLPPADAKKKPDAGTVTLALDQNQAQQLVSAQQVAERVWLTLRPFGESDTPDVAPYDVVVFD